MTTATQHVGKARFGVALIILVMYGVALFTLVTMPVPDVNKEAFLLLLGGLGPALGAIVGYYFNIATRRTNGP